MPHLQLEYSHNVSFGPGGAHELLAAAHDACCRVQAFAATELKSRAIKQAEVLVGRALPADAAAPAGGLAAPAATRPAAEDAGGSGGENFVHVTLALLAGRSPDVRAALCAAIYGAVSEGLAGAARSRPCRLSVEVREMDPAGYRKGLVPAAAR